jgi:hypothetical protein
MTLILTELSDTGIAMAADSAVSILINGRISTRDQKRWKKLLKVPRIEAAISYWGSVGLITRVRFDEWLKSKIQNGNYNDLRSFADYLAEEMNKSAGGRPLKDKQPAGIHVAGFQQWPDGARRSTFYHIHNGHGRCHHSASMNADWLPDAMPVRSLCSRMVCTRCGMIGADVRTDWSPHVNKRHV